MWALFDVSAFAQNIIRLQGAWDYALGDSTKYSDYVMLPGLVPTADKVWFKRGVYVPLDWQKRHITLFLERLYGEAVVFINGKQVGLDTIRCAPHQYDVSQFVLPGQRNTLAVCVATQETEGRNGIFGRMELRGDSRQLFFRQVHFQPFPYEGRVHIDLTVDGNGLRFDDYVAEVVAQCDRIDSARIIQGLYPITKRHSEFNFFLGNEIALWDDYHPNLYRIGIFLGDEDYYEVSIGMRELSVDGSQLMINRRPLHLRGVVVDNPFVESVNALSVEQAWLDILTKYKERGFNLLRFRSYCPMEAAYAMADQLGLFLLPGGDFSPNEKKRMINAYGHHPSFVMKEDLLVDSRVH